MAVTHANGVRNSLANVVGDAHDVGGGTSVLEIRDGATVLVSFNLPNPAFDTAPATGVGQISVLGVPITAVGVADGDADNFVTKDRAGTQVLAGSVTGVGLGGDIEVSNINIVTSQECELESLTYTGPT